MKVTKESKYNALFNKLIDVNDLPNRLIEIAKDLEYPIFRKMINILLILIFGVFVLNLLVLNIIMMLL